METEKLTGEDKFDLEYYQPLFDKLSEFGMIALESEMQEIIEVVELILNGKAVKK